MPTMSRRQREAALSMSEKYGQEQAVDMLAMMGYTDEQIARAFIPEPEEPESGTVIRFLAMGSYNYAAIRIGAYWYITNDGARRSSAVPKQRWDDLLAWGGQQMRDTLQVMVPVEAGGTIASKEALARISEALRVLENPDIGATRTITDTIGILRGTK